MFFGEVKNQLTPLNITVYIINEWNSVSIFDVFPVKHLNDFLWEQNILHTNCLYLYLRRSMWNKYFLHLKFSKFLCIERIDLILCPLTHLTIFRWLVSENIWGPTEHKDVELVVIFIKIIPSIDSWIIWLLNFKLILHYVINHKLIVVYVIVFLINDGDKIYPCLFMRLFAEWEFHLGEVTLLSFVSVVIFHHVIPWESFVILVVFDTSEGDLFKLIIGLQNIHRIVRFQHIFIRLQYLIHFRFGFSNENIRLSELARSFLTTCHVLLFPLSWGIANEEDENRMFATTLEEHQSTLLVTTATTELVWAICFHFHFVSSEIIKEDIILFFSFMNFYHFRFFILALTCEYIWKIRKLKFVEHFWVIKCSISPCIALWFHLTFIWVPLSPLLDWCLTLVEMFHGGSSLYHFLRILIVGKSFLNLLFSGSLIFFVTFIPFLWHLGSRWFCTYFWSILCLVKAKFTFMLLHSLPSNNIVLWVLDV